MTLTTANYYNTAVFCFVFELGSKVSFEAVKTQIQTASPHIPSTSVKFLVGAKADAKSLIRPDEITEVCVRYGLIYQEVSAKNDAFVTDVCPNLPSYSRKPKLISLVRFRPKS